MDEKHYLAELEKYTSKILDSNAPRKLIVAGPGTGKTTFFKKAINHYGGTEKDYLILTFINNLEDELREGLGDIAKVFTFHGYCHSLLRKDPNLRFGLQNNFEYFPALIKIVKSDWEITGEEEIPQFSKMMRNGTRDKLDFFLTRGNYYNATGYDDSVFRVYKSLIEGETIRDRYKLIIVDEYQDFNFLETSVLSHIIKSNPALIVGDDDQALYCQLRDSSPEFIRRLFKENDFKNFELPFCLRCPNAVISVFDSVVAMARRKGLLGGRINKRFRFFPPVKGGDSKKYPTVKLVISSIQKKSPASTNYFGRYILREIQQIPAEEIAKSYEGHFPTVLIIGPSYYLRTVVPIFESEGYAYELSESKKDLELDIKEGFRILKNDMGSNLGWRIVLETSKPDFYRESISTALSRGLRLVGLIPKTFIGKFRKDIELFEENKDSFQRNEKTDTSMPSIKLTTFEGAKGLSAQHVFILGLQNGDLPRNALNISDIEICKFLVALTRTRKQCHILSTYYFGGKKVFPSEFLNWLGDRNVEHIKIDKTYWDNTISV